jgi:hypothetical protein
MAMLPNGEVMRGRYSIKHSKMHRALKENKARGNKNFSPWDIAKAVNLHMREVAAHLKNEVEFPEVEHVKDGVWRHLEMGEDGKYIKIKPIQRDMSTGETDRDPQDNQPETLGVSEMESV